MSKVNERAEDLSHEAQALANRIGNLAQDLQKAGDGYAADQLRNAELAVRNGCTYLDQVADRYDRHSLEGGRRWRVRSASGGSDPTPRHLRKLADWFDDPESSPACPISLSHVQPAVLECIQPGYLLRRIADELEAQTVAAHTPNEGGQGG